jgi:hypothetical protein
MTLAAFHVEVKMAGAPKLLVKKYFGSATIQQMEFTLDEAKGFLDYFWTKDGSSNVIVSVDGQAIKSYEELVAVASQDRYKNKGFMEVGLFLSNDGSKSIWSK